RPPMSSPPAPARTPWSPARSLVLPGAPTWPPDPPAARGAPAEPWRPSKSHVLVELEAEHPRGVLRGDRLQVRLGNPGEHAVQEGSRLRPRRLGVREVAAPEHGVHADRLTELDPEIVLHELHEHVAAPVVTRQQPFLRSPALGEHRPLAIREVHLLQPVRNPGRLVLDRADPQPRIAIEDA